MRARSRRVERLTDQPALGVRTPARRAAMFAWSALGLADILLVVATAQYLLLVRGDRLLGEALSRTAYGLLPTFVVPLVVLTHLLVLARTRPWRADREG